MKAIRLLCLALALLAGAALRAASAQAWALGCQPQATVPYFEMDPELSTAWSLGPGGRDWRGGLNTRAGLSDYLEAGLSLAQAPALGLGASAKAALAPEGEQPLDPGLMAETAWSQAPGFSGAAGLVLGRGLGQSDAAANLLWSGGSAWDLRLGLRSPYVLTSLRLAAEARALLGPQGAAWTWAPQAWLDLPGDISLNLAGLIPADGSAGWSLRLALSVELFPNP
jgi:hypothetical protein